MSQKKLWTLTVDYFATGEGRTLIGMICYGETEEEVKNKFIKEFGDYMSLGVDIKIGIVKNDVIKLLFTEPMIKFAQENENKCNLSMKSEIHYNFG